VALAIGSLRDDGLVGNGASPGFASNASGLGSAITVDLYRDLSYQVSGTFTATVKVQGSLDGVTWFDDGAAMSSSTLRAASAIAYVFLRATMTAYTSGTVQVLVAGHRET
jgi:hypothetical protein